jgi:hypothetical protein
MERILPRSLFYSALQRVDPFTTVGVGAIFYFLFRKIQAQEWKIQELDQRILAQGKEILKLNERISKFRWVLIRFWARAQIFSADAAVLRAKLLSTFVQLGRAQSKLDQLEKRIIPLEDFKKLNKFYVWNYAFVVATHILRECLGTYELQKLLAAKNEVYLNLLRAKFSANIPKTQQKITDQLVRIMDVRHDVAHPPAASLEMRALGPLIRTLETLQDDADVPKDMGLVIHILCSKLLPR